MFDTLRKKYERHKVRQELRGMTDRQLSDIGISRYDINRIVR